MGDETWFVSSPSFLLARQQTPILGPGYYAEAGGLKEGNKKSLENKRLFIVDSTRIALVSSGTNTDMLLHTPRARVHNLIVNKKSSFYKKLLLWYPTCSFLWSCQC